MMKTTACHPKTGMRSAEARPLPVRGADWRKGLPVLGGEHVVLRELRSTDGPALATLLIKEEVSRFISPPPGTVEAFDRSIELAHEQRAAGTAVWYAVTLKGFDTPIGMFQVRAIEPAFATGEWGFAVSSAFWGTGVFEESAALVLEFAFGTLGVHRLEARVAVGNGRGIGALRKLGAAQEGLLRKSFLQNGEYLDQVLCTIVDEDWRMTRQVAPALARIQAPVH